MHLTVLPHGMQCTTSHHHCASIWPQSNLSFPWFCVSLPVKFQWQHISNLYSKHAAAARQSHDKQRYESTVRDSRRHDKFRVYDKFRAGAWYRACRVIHDSPGVMSARRKSIRQLYILHILMGGMWIVETHSFLLPHRHFLWKIFIIAEIAEVRLPIRPPTAGLSLLGWLPGCKYAVIKSA